MKELSINNDELICQLCKRLLRLCQFQANIMVLGIALYTMMYATSLNYEVYTPFNYEVYTPFNYEVYTPFNYEVYTPFNT